MVAKNMSMSLTHEELKTRLMALRETMVAMAAEHARHQAQGVGKVVVQSNEGHRETRAVLKHSHDGARAVVRALEGGLDCLDVMVDLAQQAQSDALSASQRQGLIDNYGMFARDLAGIGRDAQWEQTPLFTGEHTCLVLPTGENDAVSLPLINLLAGAQRVSALKLKTSTDASDTHQQVQALRERMLDVLDQVEKMGADLGKRCWSLSI